MSFINYRTRTIVVSAVQDNHHLPASWFHLSTFAAFVLSCKRHSTGQIRFPVVFVMMAFRNYFKELDMTNVSNKLIITARYM